MGRDRPSQRETDRELLRLAVPALGALIAEPLYILADTAVVGRLGTDLLGGLAIASTALLIGLNAFVFLAYGTTAAVSRLLGAGEDDRAAHQAVQSLWLALGVGLVLLVVGQLVALPLLRVLGAKGEVLVNAEIYLRVSLFGVPAMLLALAGVGYLRGLKDTVRPLQVAVVTAVLNLVIEVVLIYGFDQSIGASALSTVIAQWVGAAAYLWWIGRAVRARDVTLRPDLAAVGRLAVVGFDLLLRTVALRGAFVVATAVAARIGTDDLAGHQIGIEIWALLALALDALAIAAQSMIGTLLGAGKVAEARAVGRRVIAWSIVLGVGLGLVVLASRPVVPSIFTTDPAVEAVAAFVLLHVALQQPLNGVVFALDGILIGAGDMRFLAVAMAASAAVFVPLAVAVRVADAGLGLLWAALWVFMTVRAALLLARFRSAAWAVPGAGP